MPFHSEPCRRGAISVAHWLQAFVIAAIVCAALCATWRTTAAASLLSDPSPAGASQSPSTLDAVAGAIGAAPEALALPAEAAREAETAKSLRVYLPAVLGASSAPATSKPAPDADPIARTLLDALNAARQGAGCALLTPDARLTRAAQGHSRDMAEHSFMDHVGSDGAQPHERALREGYRYQYIGEAIARMNTDRPADVLVAWLASPDHARILLNCIAEDTGIGHDSGYWTIMVGREF